MRRFAFLPLIALVFACAKSETPATDTAAAPGAVAAPAGLELSQVAGTWNVRTMREGSDSTVNTFVLTTTNTRDGWTIKFADREPIPIRIVDVSGDSIVYEAGPFPSVLRPGLQASIHTVTRLQDGKLIGRTRARYSGANVGADTVAMLRNEGVRAQ